MKAPARRKKRSSKGTKFVVFCRITAEERAAISEGIALTGESQSRFVGQSCLLRAKVVKERAQIEADRAHELTADPA
jgi:uncharacterized protein (DUF1778 family)